MEILIWVGIMVMSIVVLVIAAEYFTRSAEVIGHFFKLPSFIIGVTIVAFGTSLPELLSSFYAAEKGHSEIVVGNVIGSNVANILMILGLTAIISGGVKIKHKLIGIDFTLLLAAVLLVLLVTFDGEVSVPEGVACLFGLFVYLLYVAIASNKSSHQIVRKPKIKKQSLKLEKIEKSFFVLLVSLVFLYFGAKFAVSSVVELSENIKIGKDIIAASAMALGTTLPELVVSVQAARKKKTEIAIGNIIGSNIFNSFGVLGIPAMFGMLTVSREILIIGLPSLIFATVLFLFFAYNRIVSRREGFILLFFYFLYLGKLFSFF